MSISAKTSRQSAIEYNQKAITRLNLTQVLPMKFLEDYRTRVGADALVEAVSAFQKLVGETSEEEVLIDGKLGPQTLELILERYEDSDKNYFLFNRTRLYTDANLVRYDEPNGLDLHPHAHFTPRFFDSEEKQIRRIVLHWGGLNPHHLYRCFSGVRKVSSHIGVGLDGDEAKTYQYLNFMHKAWHGGSANSSSIGIDICQQPGLNWSDYYKKNGYNVFEMQNVSGRGDISCLSLDDRILEELVKVIRTLLSEVLRQPLRAPKTNEVINPAEYNLIGHHHISKKKWDVAPWWDEIIEALD